MAKPLPEGPESPWERPFASRPSSRYQRLCALVCVAADDAGVSMNTVWDWYDEGKLKLTSREN
ncbi:hypothetical protein LCGC14_1181730 [marine sediment metagenome]|uniref:Uncharacterized protein n=1 Tax=marine sediment metagenome TaxID=412755 RepID=A0A0F9M9M2_9ZZZZ